MKNQKLIAISAGQNLYKKETNPIKKHIRYLNYGLLGLVTMLHDTLGMDVVMAQGDNYFPDEFLERLEGRGIRMDAIDAVLLSVPSYYSVSWCAEFCRIIKEKYNKEIIVGGRWVVDNNTEWVKKKLKYVDCIIEGFGERKLAELFCPERAHLIPDGATQCFKHLNYELLLDYQFYQPSIEISRGCGSGCLFCADRANKRLANASVEGVISEMDYLDKIYGDYSVYLEAPHFCFNREWCDKFARAIGTREKRIPWRCTTRVESVPTEMIKTLASSGLKILDIGMESASSKQLIRMNKTKNPEKYLNKVVEILKECDKHDVWVKLNVLLYAGETEETIQQTKDWLNEYKHLIKGISVSSLVYYKGAGDINELISQGARVPKGHDVEELGYVDLDLSDEISLAQAKEHALSLSRMVMTKKDYYDIKSISYFERGYTYENFLEEVATCDKRLLPFDTN